MTMEALGRCRWCYAIGVLAIGFMACSAYGAMSPITDESNEVNQSVDPDVVRHKLISTADRIDVSEVVFTTDGGLRDTGFCTPPVGGPNHTCNAPTYLGGGPGTPEGEVDVDPTCGLVEGGDNFNAGCNSQLVPPPFSPISCGETICGTWAAIVQGTTSLRDTDFYEVTFTEPTLMIVDITAEFDVHLGLLSSCGTGECGMQPPFPDYWTAGGSMSAACNDPLQSPGGEDAGNYHMEACVQAGTWWIFVSGAWAQAPVDCRDYVLTLDCVAPCHVPCCTDNDVCVETSYTVCRYTEEMCGPGHLGGSPQEMDMGDCTAGLCLWGCATAETLFCNTENTIDNSGNDDIAHPPMSCATGDSIGLLWFQFVADNVSVEIQTCNTIESDDSVFALYDSDCATYMTELACSEDEDCEPGNWNGYLCHYEPPLVEGETYYIQFAAWQESSQGVYRLDIKCPCPVVGEAACCLPNGSCTMKDLGDCTDLDGSYQGFPTTCDDPGICDLGACCLSDGSCIPGTNILCCGPDEVCGVEPHGLGVEWFAGEICDPNPCAGACCTFLFGAYICDNKSAASCALVSQTFYPGQQCETPLFECTDFRICLHCADTTAPFAGPWECDDAHCQYPDSDNWPGGIVAGSSDENPLAGNPAPSPNGFHRADDFIPLDTPIEKLCWWGAYLDIADPEPEPPPNEIVDDFTVTYYASDVNLCPVLPAIASFNEGLGQLTVNRTPWGERILPGGPYPTGHQIWIYEGDHDPVDVEPEQCYWLEIVNDTHDGSVPATQSRLWFWVTAPFYQGNGFSLANDGPAASGYSNWMFPDEPCHAVTYRDFDLAFCLCVPNDPCVHCENICAGATVNENETACDDGYLDTYNEGCSVADWWTPIPPNMVDVECEDVVCGKTGNYECESRCDDNDDCPTTETCDPDTHFCTGYPYNCRDVDWYRITLPPTYTYYELELSLTGTAPMYTEMYTPYGIDECRQSLGQVMLIPAPACHSDGDWSVVGPGIYYLFTAPDNIFEGLVCDEHEYVFHTHCVGQGGDCTATACESCRYHPDYDPGPPEVPEGPRLCLDMGLSGGIEPRLGGILELDITVDDASGALGPVTVDCTPCDYTGTGTASVDGNVVTVTFDTALPNKCCCTVTLACDDGSGSAEVCVCGLEGEIDRDDPGAGVVSPGDASIIKAKFGKTPTEAIAEFDYDADGLISPGDFSLVKARFGNTLVNSCP